MFFYISLYSVGAVLLILGKKTKRNQKKYIYFFIALLFAFISGIRYGIGTDYFYTYYPEYLSILNGTKSYQANFDIGVYGLFYLCAKTGLGFHFALFIISFCTLICFFLGTFKFSKKINFDAEYGMFIILMLYYQLSFNIVRQVLAMSLLFLAVSDLAENDSEKVSIKKKIKINTTPLILTILAVTCHKTAILFILVYFAIKMISTKKYLMIQILVVIITIYLVINNELFTQVLIKLRMESFLPYLRNVDLNVTIGYIIRMLPMVFVLIFMRKEISEDKSLYAFTLLYILGYVFRLLAYNDNNNIIYLVASSQADRISHYFMLFQSVIYAKFLKNKYCGKFSPFIKTALVGLLLILWFYDYGIVNLNGTIPYKSMFS